MTTPESKKEVIVLIHGTFAKEDSDEGDKWFQRGSSFERAVTRASASQGLNLETRVFRWSGENSEAARRKDAEQLFAACRELEEKCRKPNAEDPTTAYHLIAHSHGGAVIWHALRNKQPLEHLKSVVTVGTPFFSFRNVRAAFLFALPFFTALALLPAFVERAAVLVDQWGVLLHDRNDVATLVGLAILGLAFVTLVLYSGWTLYGAVGAASRCWKMRRDAHLVWRRYGSKWHIVSALEDEAIHGLSRMAESSPPAIAARRPTRSKGRPRPAGRLARPFLRLIDLVIWRWLSARSFGNDCRGEQLGTVHAMPPGAGEAEPRVARQINEDVTEGANRRTADRIKELRGDLTSSLLVSGETGDVLDILKNIEPDLLIHTSYFDEGSVQDKTVQLLRDTPDRDEEQLQWHRAEVAATDRHSTLTLVAVCLTLLTLSLIALFSEPLYRNNVYAHTDAARIDRILSRAALEESARGGAIRAVSDWLTALLELDDPERFDQAMRTVVREFSALEEGPLFLTTLNEGSDAVDVPEAEPMPDHDAAPERFGRVMQLLARNGWSGIALAEMRWLDERFYDDNEPHLPEVAAECLQSEYPALALTLGIEETPPFGLLQPSVEAASRGDDTLALGLIMDPGVPQFGDFAENDELIYEVVRAAREGVHALAMIRGAAVAEKFAAAIGGSLNDDGVHLFPLDVVTGCLEGDRDEEAWQKAREMVDEKHDPALVIDAAGMVALEHRDLAVARQAFDLAVASYRSLESRTERRMAIPALFLAAKRVDGQTEGILRDALELAKESDPDSDIWRWTIYELLRLKRLDKVEQLVRAAGLDGSPLAGTLLEAAGRLARRNEPEDAYLVLTRLSDARERPEAAFVGGESHPPPAFQLATATSGSIDLSAYQEIIEGNPEGLRKLQGRELKFALMNFGPSFPDVEALLSATDRLAEDADRIDVLELLGGRREERTEREALWRRLAQLAEKLGRGDKLAVAAAGLAWSVDLDKAGAFSELEGYLQQLAASKNWPGQLELSAALLSTLAAERESR